MDFPWIWLCLFLVPLLWAIFTFNLAIPLRDDWFEEREGTPAGSVEPLKDFLEQLVVVLHITETLDLNTRIWTKA
jgi:hypothetical protein